MELKVWVDGIQRVVCGVTESTTCQDVVFALAHATGQTGRFTLVERWRNNERLLAPQENPLKVLMKWGEYANDVQFVLRRSVLDPKAHSGTTKQSNHSNKRQHDFLHSFSPPNSSVPVSKPPSQGKEIKKSFTFSGGHASSGSSNDSTPVPSNSSTPSKVETPKPVDGKDPDIWQIQENTVVNRTSTQKPPEPQPKIHETDVNPTTKPDRPKHPPSYDEAISRSGSRYPASHHPRDGSPYSRDFESPSVKRRHMSTHRIHQLVELEHSSPSRPYLEEQQRHHTNASHNQHQEGLKYRGRSPLNTHSSYSGAKIVQDGISVTGTSVPRQTPERVCQNNGSNSEGHVLKPRRNAIGVGARDGGVQKDGVHKVVQPGRTSHDRESEEDAMREAQYKDLLRLVTLQREKLNSQQCEMTQFDAEIGFWEAQLQEQEQRLAVLEQELRRLERVRQEQDSELALLDQHGLVKDIEVGRQEERTLHSEITLARSRLANCETELLQVRQRVHHLQEEITEERQRNSLREEQEKHEREEQEKKLEAQLEEIKLQVQTKTEEYEKQKESVEKLESSVKDVETNLSERQKQVEKLLQEIREENLQSLSLSTPDDPKHIVEGRVADFPRGSFLNRPGSTRKIIGSPRQLENAVPTSKNPHGVWV